MIDEIEVRTVFVGFFNELLAGRMPANGDELRLCWREAVEATREQFEDWGAEIETQWIYAIVDEVERDAGYVHHWINNQRIPGFARK